MTPAALKVRPTKPWRHPTLDRRLTRQRVLAEARVLVKCRRDGVPVPAVWAVDWERGWCVLEWIEGVTVKEGIRRWGREMGRDEDELRTLLRNLGTAVGRLHRVGVVHGDLTTSNMMLREEEGAAAGTAGLSGGIVLIDFGLATQAVQDEDRAVDLYVLERAFGSTHPAEEAWFGDVLGAYGESYPGARAALRRLEDVRMRGRKKSMIG
jgi:TP53 regulating kinase-like protein